MLVWAMGVVGMSAIVCVGWLAYCSLDPEPPAFHRPAVSDIGGTQA